MRFYADSSFLVSLYRRDGNSFEAHSIVKKQNTPLPYTSLHQLEVNNALRLAVRRKEMNESELFQSIHKINSGFDEGVLSFESIAWVDVFRRAEQLSKKHAVSTGARSYDILHVAIALERKTQYFLTFDKVQKNLAKAAGMKTRP